MKRIITCFLIFLSIGLVSCEKIDNGPFDFSSEFVTACDKIELDTSLIYNWKQIEDWANGERFSFKYENHSFITYINNDKSVNSINLDTVKIYEQGYEPYKVNDYLVDVDFMETLIPYAEDKVKPILNYPSTADFALLDWSYGREGNLYQLQSSVTAENGFGVEDTISFAVILEVDSDGNKKCVYLEMNGSVIEDNRPATTERVKISNETKIVETEKGAIRLIDGELGEYGKNDEIYPDFVDYYIPAGKYNTICNSKTGTIMIIDNETNDEVGRVTLSTGETGSFEIKPNEHIELEMYSDVTLTAIS
ncbi:MAG: hypothetical protein LBM93_00750 [Oscillospiraceae bacterium]|jgi:hypothetical protein|nr:hypothetical protein [Oscillospiraceae bacterium]